LIELPELPAGQEFIQSILPHRYPFLLVDKIVELEPKKRAVGIKAVTYNEPFFQGHFPQLPIMPGVLVLEAIAQVAGIMALVGYEHPINRVPVLASIERAKFRRPVRPGDLLILSAELIWERLNSGKVKGTAQVDSELVAEGEFLFSFVPIDKLQKS